MIAAARTLTARPIEGVPTLRLHLGGHYFARIPKRLGGGSKWFGKDPTVAGELYRAWAEEEWPLLLGKCCATSATATRRGRMTTTTAISAQSVADSLFALVDSEAGPFGRRNIRLRLKPFLAKHGAQPIADIRPADLIAFKADLAKRYGIETQNNLIVATRRLLNHAWEIEAVDRPFRLGIFKPVRRGPLPKKGIKPEQVRALIAEVYKHHPDAARMLLLGFYCVARPSETPRIMHSIGEVQETGNDGRVLAIYSKTTRKTSELRPVLCIPEAEKLMGSVPTMKTHNAYRIQVYRAGELIGAKRLQEITGKKTLAPHFMRHSANQALIDAGVSSDFRHVGLGRVPARVDRTYGVQQEFSAALKTIRVLAKLVPLSTVGL